jgi:hypothetical protein
MNFTFPPPAVLANREKLSRFFWEQREAWHIEVLSRDGLSDGEHEWHAQRLEFAQTKLERKLTWAQQQP